MPSPTSKATSTMPDASLSTGEFTIFQRVLDIPLVAAALDERLLATLIAPVDDLANTIFNLAETRSPHLFYAPPDDSLARLTKHATSFDDARTMVDKGIKGPALHVAEGVDERLAPLVDYYENQIEPLSHKSAGSTRAKEHIEGDEMQHQYQRAINLANALTKRVTSVPSSPLQQTTFPSQRSVIQVQDLSDTMLEQLHALSITFPCLATSLHRSVSAPQKQLMITLVEAANALSAIIANLQATLASKDLTTGEHIDRAADFTTARITSPLERMRAGMTSARTSRRANGLKKHVMVLCLSVRALALSAYQLFAGECSFLQVYLCSRGHRRHGRPLRPVLCCIGCSLTQGTANVEIVEPCAICTGIGGQHTRMIEWDPKHPRTLSPT
ncbi:uncharacterized protein SCHCODRAFT_02602614 [Schizophyllum commune H4-8]|uniref:Uncharacterized protein n=1 Tax=Schizophyllum commune (strain H4-8 / FGSC 9210) TaxID=578458 RepID=D8QGR3_SCHCM|nr:uncharacterized protein SCHCODRAFT_02602614 [Schizophyllum commune H4-8]KAI5886837.1 hypothetical protein SCHCODRAFT_02602614 [Schizophyllum commune H4-8]